MAEWGVEESQVEPIVIVVLIVAVLGIMRSSRKRSQSPENHHIAIDVPEFRVVSLGLSGSGKTLLLASMYNQLHAAMQGRSYWVEAPSNDARKLRAWFQVVSDTSSPHEWPSGTGRGDTRDFEFAACARENGESVVAFKLRYKEYAGELLSDHDESGSDARDELQLDINQAATVLCLLDGADILRCIRGDSSAQSRVEFTVSTLVDSLRRAGGSLNFVVTKWDLLDGIANGESERMELVRTLLWRSPKFRSLVLDKGRGRTVRLIPVGAVGTGFATLSQSGAVVKQRSAEARPSRVTLPLAAVVPDLLSRVGREMERRNQARKAQQQRRDLRPSATESLRMNLATLTDVVGELVSVAGPAAALYARWVDPILAERERAVRESNSAWDEQLNATDQAAQRIVKEMQREVDELERDLPDSVLSSDF
jgi:double-GTPase-like protein